jgi:hypothetical protein
MPRRVCSLLVLAAVFFAAAAIGGSATAGGSHGYDFDFSRLTCSGADLATLQNVYVYLQPGTFYVDKLRAE